MSSIIKYGRYEDDVVRIISRPDYMKYVKMYVSLYSTAKEAGAKVPRHQLVTVDGIHFFNLHYKYNVLPRLLKVIQGKTWPTYHEALEAIWKEFLALNEPEFEGEFKRLLPDLARAMNDEDIAHNKEKK